MKSSPSTGLPSLLADGCWSAASVRGASTVVALIAVVGACGGGMNQRRPRQGSDDASAGGEASAGDDAGPLDGSIEVDSAAGDDLGPLDGSEQPDSVADAPPSNDDADDGAVPCGSGTCAAGQICVQDSCGGGPVQCVALGDSGTCQPGWQPRLVCPATGGPGCDPPPCSDPPPRCAALPAACAAGLTCQCITQSSICGSLSCASDSGRGAHCAAE